MEVDLKEMAKSLPPEALPVLQSNGYFEPDLLSVGSTAPRIALAARDDGRMVAVGAAGAERPTVLIFGSYT